MQGSQTSATVVLLRHAEKPDDVSHGVDEQGRRDEHSLTVRGWQRAGALVRWLAPSDAQSPFGRPAAVWAAPATGPHPSHRPELTVTPLARYLNLSVNSAMSVGDHDAAASAVLADALPAVVSWRHDDLPELARTFASRMGADPNAIPSDWPEERFDLAWVFERNERGIWSFRQVPQCLLEGDRTSALPAPNH
ncbi:MAG TPA: phosphoglycerate mutase family protein [Burkholderiaceae bacterium]|nr:phosphoglycerate mutase family protein [Burkholderiaceae bacterium]